MYARETNIGITKYTNLPKFWNGINGFQYADQATRETNGFFELIKPTIAQYQRLVNLHFATDHFTYDVEDFTAAEIEEAIDEQVKSDLVNEIQDGVDASHQLKTYLKKNLNPNQYKNARKIVLPVWIALRHGDWDLALDEMNDIDVSVEPYIAMKQVIINHIEEYINAS